MLENNNEKIITAVFVVLVIFGLFYIVNSSITGYASLFFEENEEHTIYNLVENVLWNSSNIVVVVDRDTDVSEIDAASELTGFLGVLDSRFDDEVNLSGNQILVGKDNVLVNELISWDLSEGETLIQVIERGEEINLIVAGTDASDTQQAVDIIIDFEYFPDELNTDCVKINDYIIEDCEVVVDGNGGGSPGNGGGSSSSDDDYIGEIFEEEECYEDWICDEWSECIEGMQYRNCEDWNLCGTEEFMPEIERECEIEPVIEEPGIVDVIEEEKEEEVDLVKINFLIPIIFIILIVAVVVYFVYKKYYVSEVIVPSELKSYVDRNIDSFSKDEIKEALLKRGWDKKVVDEVLKISK